MWFQLMFLFVKAPLQLAMAYPWDDVETKRDVERGFKYLFIFNPTWGHDPIWRAYFSGGLHGSTTNW